MKRSMKKTFWENTTILNIKYSVLLFQFAAAFYLQAVPISSIAAPIKAQSSCMIIYQLKKETAQEFEHQKQQLQPHIERKRVQLLDLTDWANQLSGRKRNQLKRQFEFKESKNNLVVIDKKGKILVKMREHIDLVNALLHCK